MPNDASPPFNETSRLVLVAPHPVDVAAACGLVLQRARRAGAAVRVIYATSGHYKPGSRRFFGRKWTIRASDRAQWVKRRRAEAVAALSALDLASCDTKFLDLPDQGLTSLLLQGCDSSLEQLRGLVREWKPTHVVVPSIADTQPDHSALGVMLRMALNDPGFWEKGVIFWAFVVHGPGAAFLKRAEELQASDAEVARKLDAFASHKAQLKLSRRKLLGFAQRPEHLARLEQHENSTADGCIVAVSRRPQVLTFQLRSRFKFLARAEADLFVVGRRNGHEMAFSTTRVPLRASPIANLNVPTAVFASEYPLFVKLEPRGLFYDGSGWLEISALRNSRRIVYFDGKAGSDLASVR